MSARDGVKPWGRLVGLLVASFTTLVGVLAGLEPATILQRAGCAGLIAGVAAGLLAPSLRKIAS